MRAWSDIQSKFVLSFLVPSTSQLSCYFFSLTKSRLYFLLLLPVEDKFMKPATIWKERRKEVSMLWTSPDMRNHKLAKTLYVTILVNWPHRLHPLFFGKFFFCRYLKAILVGDRKGNLEHTYCTWTSFSTCLWETPLFYLSAGFSRGYRYKKAKVRKHSWETQSDKAGR